MARKPKNEKIQCEHYSWVLKTKIRTGVFFADGRGNKPDLGRHSLGTRSRDAALVALRELDNLKAVEHGRAAPRVNPEDGELVLQDGWSRYINHLSRPAIQGGVSAKTLKRYRTVFEKFSIFCLAKRITTWNQVNEDVLSGYGRWLEEKDYHDTTQSLELITLKQTLNWMIWKKQLPQSSQFRLTLEKSKETTTYCYTREQVAAMIDHCRGRDDLHWLADVIVALALTGFRIGELAELRWENLDLEKKLIQLVDRSRQTRRSERTHAPKTKSHRSRSLPIRPELLEIFNRLPRHKDGRVFHGPSGGKIKPDTLRNILNREVLKPLSRRFPKGVNGLGIAAGRLHSFRHYFCSICADNGVSEQMLMGWLGHRDSAMIRRYYHLRIDESRRQMEGIPFLPPRAVEGPDSGTASP